MLAKIGHVLATASVFVLCLTTSLIAQEKTSVEGRAILFPWLTPGVDPKLKQELKNNLLAAQNNLKELMFANSSSLDQFSAKLNVKQSLNQKRLSQKITIGISKLSQETNRVTTYIQPVICNGGSHVTASLIAGEINSGKLIAIKSNRYRINRLSAQKQNLLTALSETPWREWLRSTFAKIDSKEASSNARDALKLSLSIKETAATGESFSDECATFLAATELNELTNVTIDLGWAKIIHARSALDIKQPLQRANRRLVLNALPSNEANTQKEFRYTYSDAIFASLIRSGTIPDPLGDNTKSRFQIDGSIRSLIKSSQQNLRTEGAVKIVKQIGAWVYLDRGRGWGLEMGDRLISGEESELIKGHIIRFFGVEEKLLSAEGYLIEDGSIAFIRKGQKKVKQGQTMLFDPSTFPSAWPPTKAP